MPLKSKKNPDISLDKEVNLRNDFPPTTTDEWRAKVERDLKGYSLEEKLVSQTPEEIDLHPLYTKEDLEEIPGISSFPGFIHYLRGTRAGGYVKTPWEICQEIIGFDPKGFNRELKLDLQMGQTAINLILDRSICLGLEPNEADAGVSDRKGVGLTGLDDLSAALSGLKLNSHQLYINTGFSALPMLMMLEALLNQRHENIEQLKGGIEADPLGFMVTEGKLPISVERALDYMACCTKWVRERMAEIRTIGIDVSVYQNAGASATLELALAMATAVEYINQLQDRNLNIDDIAQQMRFTFGIGSHFFMEVAKFRAARLLWAKIVQEFGGRESSRKMKVHARTSWHLQSFYDPYLNILRSTTGAFSAIMGGVDSLHSGAFNESFSVPDGFSRRLARNIQLILLKEAHVNQPVDPAGGSYYIECLTSRVAEKSWQIFQEVIRSGGMLESLRKGLPQLKIDRLNEHKRNDFARLKTVMIGINGYVNSEDDRVFSDFIEKVNVKNPRKPKKPKAWKPNRYFDRLSFSLKSPPGDIIRAGMQAFLSGATWKDVSFAINKYEKPSFEVSKIKMFRLAEMFEELRIRLLLLSKKRGFRPKVIQLVMGKLPDYKPQADFSEGLFRLPGFEVLTSPAGLSPAESVDLVLHSGARIVVICLGQDGFAELAQGIIRELKKKKPDIIVFMTGSLPREKEKFIQLGVEAFIYQGVDAHEILQQLISKIEGK
jgi:methylmalonyl-CoA mutase